MAAARLVSWFCRKSGVKEPRKLYLPVSQDVHPRLNIPEAAVRLFPLYQKHFPTDTHVFQERVCVLKRWMIQFSL